MSKLRFCLTTLMLVSFSAAAMAIEPPATAAQVVRPVKRPHPSPTQIFQRLDKNHDGLLTLDEFLAAPWVKNKARAEKLFVWMDTNKDGRVSLQEFLAACARQTRDYTTVQNGYLACGSSYVVQLGYPCGWNYCWPWRYGWYWNNGWNHRPGAWWGWGYDHWRQGHPYRHAGHYGHHNGHGHRNGPAHRGHHPHGHHKGPGHRGHHPHGHRGHHGHGHGHGHGHK